MLKKLLKETKTATLEYPGKEGFKVTIGLISAELANKLTRESTETVAGQYGMREEKVNNDKFLAKFTAKAILNWEGLTGAHIKDMLPVDESELADTDEIPYSQEDALLLIQNCKEFEGWVNAKVFDLRSFRGDTVQ